MKIPEKMTNNSSKYTNDIHTIQKGEGFELTLSMDCEGTNYDKNMQENVRHLEKFLQQATENGITTILFVTALFARELKKQNLLPHLQNNYRVIFGLHIHPENLPQDIAQKLDFLREGEEYLANYTLEEQRQIIAHVMEDLKESGVSELQIFRGGQFSMNDDTVKILLEDTNISAESHNPFREQYNIETGKLRSIPVYAKSRDVEMRLEFFETQDLVQMAKEAEAQGEKMLAITHSYMLDPKDFHYERDGIVNDIHKRLEKIIEAVK